MTTESRRQPTPPQPGEQIRLPEPFGAPKNSFADFIASPSAQAYIDATRELQGEIAAWLKSEEALQLEETILDTLRPITSHVDIKELHTKAKQILSLMTYGSITEGLFRKTSAYLDSVAPAQKTDLINKLDSEDDKDSDTETINSLKEEHKLTTSNTLDSYRQYIRNHFYDKDIVAFLTNSGKTVDHAKPLLDLLAKDAFALNGILADHTSREREQANQLNERQLEIYINRIRDEIKRDPVWSLISVGLKSAGLNPHEIPTNLIVTTIMENRTLVPERFVVEYRQSTQALIIDTVNKIKTALEPYKIKPFTIDLVNPSSVQKGKRIPKQQTQVVRIEPLVALPEKEMAEPYALTLYKQGTDLQPMNIQALTEHIQDVASKFAKGDIRMVSDIQAMVDSLATTPYGPGTKRLTGKELKIRIQGKDLALRRFDPGNTERNLKLQHEFSKRIRIAYIVIPQENIVVLDAILGHDDFDMKYSDKK